MHYTIYHNPQCSKSCAALSRLEAQNASLTVIDYQQQALSLDDLRVLVKQLGLSARHLLRSKEPIYQTLALDNPTLNDDDILRAIVNHPVLLERPIIVDGARAIIARPTEVLTTWLK